MRIKDWSKYQHFKNRTPPWIKLYRDILDDPDWHELSAGASKTLVMLWLVASEDKRGDGNLPCLKKLSFRLRISEGKLTEHLQELKHYLLHDDITMISERYHGDAPEREESRVERETEGEEILKSGQKKPDNAAPYKKIISFLNETASTSFKDSSKTTQRHIKARINEGFTFDDFKTVIKAKFDEWSIEPEMVQYIRPQTLFGTKFESYLQAANEKPQYGGKRGSWNK